MEKIIREISLEKAGNKIRLIPAYTRETNNGFGVTKVLIEKYELRMDADLRAVRDVVDTQQVLQHSGINTAYATKIFYSGGGNTMVEPYLIDITKGVERSYPYYIDEDSVIGEKLFIYRVLSYGPGSYEYATSYVCGIMDVDSFFMSKNPYHNYLDYRDILDILPEGNTEALRIWIRNECFFHENFRLRFFGEVEDFKFNVHLSRAFLNIYFATILFQRVLKFANKAEGDIYAFRS